MGLGDSADSLSGSLSGVSKKLSSLNPALKVGAVLTFGVGAAVVKATKDYEEFNRTLVKVAKTTGLNAVEFKEMETNLKSLSNSLGLAANELGNITAVAGQLGVKGVKDLTKFTDVVGQLVGATDLGAEEASLGLARILNLTGDSTREFTKNVEIAGAQTVILGNNFAVLESEIVGMSLELAKAGGLFDVSTGQILALGAVGASVGAKAESSRTALLKFYSALDEMKRGKNQEGLENLAKVLGVTIPEALNLLEEDTIGVSNVVIDRMEGMGTSAQDLLDSFGLSDVRSTVFIRSLGEVPDLIAEAIKKVNEQEIFPSEHLVETTKRLNSLSGRYDTAMQNIINSMKPVGEFMYEIFVGGLEHISAIIEVFGEKGFGQGLIDLLKTGNRDISDRVDLMRQLGESTEEAIIKLARLAEIGNRNREDNLFGSDYKFPKQVGGKVEAGDVDLGNIDLSGDDKDDGSKTVDDGSNYFSDLGFRQRKAEIEKLNKIYDNIIVEQDRLRTLNQTLEGEHTVVGRDPVLSPNTNPFTTDAEMHREILRLQEANKKSIKEQKEAAELLRREWSGVTRAIGDGMTELLTDIDSSFSDVMRNILLEISNMILRKNVIDPIAEGIGGFLSGGLFGAADGGVVSKGGQLVVGERGAEIVDLPRGSTVYPHGTMPMQKPINQTININVNGVQDPTVVRREVSAMLPEIGAYTSQVVAGQLQGNTELGRQ